MSVTKEEFFNIVIVSDIHGNISQVQQLLEWLSKDPESIGWTSPIADLVICAGDIANRDMHDSQRESAEVCIQTAAAMSSILGSLESVSARVVYVPGNHDAPASFGPEPAQLTVHSCNAHGRHIRVLPDLAVVGLGGSTPAKCLEKQIRWSCYPYENDKELSEQLDKVLTDGTVPEKQTINISLQKMPFCARCEEERANSDRDFCILLTHTGPDLSSTTICFDPSKDGPILAGSAAISRAIASAPQVFSLAIHGHIHDSYGTAVLNHGTVVINPGSLDKGNFAICTLVKRPDAPRWAISDIHFHKLPDLPASKEIIIQPKKN